MPKPGEPCKFAGCSIIARGTSGYCPVHVHIAHPCEITGCQNRVAAHSKSRCCWDHRREGARAMRKREKPWIGS